MGKASRIGTLVWNRAARASTQPTSHVEPGLDTAVGVCCGPDGAIGVLREPDGRDHVVGVDAHRLALDTGERDGGDSAVTIAIALAVSTVTSGSSIVTALNRGRRESEPPFDAHASSFVARLRSAHECSHRVDARVTAVIWQLARAVHHVLHTRQASQLAHHDGIELGRGGQASAHEVNRSHPAGEPTMHAVVDI